MCNLAILSKIFCGFGKCFRKQFPWIKNTFTFWCQDLITNFTGKIAANIFLKNINIESN